MASILGGSKLGAFVATVDRARAKAFYADALGLEIESEDDFAVVLNANGTHIRMTTVREIVVAPYTVLGWEVTDAEKTVAELTAKGVRFEKFPGLPQAESGIWDAPGGARVAWFKDPDGNLLSIAQMPPRQI
jgi:catechol 2,3-dioxygenase-like lactoylglutathione lyase family enzyme